MDNVKDKQYFIKKVLENLYDIEKFIEGITIEEFEHDELLQSGICFKYVQAFENSKNLDPNDFIEDLRYTLIKLRGFRNLIVHEYGKIDYISVYNTSVIDVPKFIKDLEKELR